MQRGGMEAIVDRIAIAVRRFSVVGSSDMSPSDRLRWICCAGYKGYKAQFGKEQALKILQNEMVGLILRCDLFRSLLSSWWLAMH